MKYSTLALGPPSLLCKEYHWRDFRVPPQFEWVLHSFGPWRMYLPMLCNIPKECRPYTCGSFPGIKRPERQADIEIHLAPSLTFPRATSSLHHIPSGPGDCPSTEKVPLELSVPHTGTLRVTKLVTEEQLLSSSLSLSNSRIFMIHNSHYDVHFVHFQTQ